MIKIPKIIQTAWDRILRNIKLTFESITVISVEIVKVVAYWTIIWADTKLIYNWFKGIIENIKKYIWD